jgi:hypothetical protein
MRQVIWGQYHQFDGRHMTPQQLSIISDQILRVSHPFLWANRGLGVAAFRWQPEERFWWWASQRSVESYCLAKLDGFILKMTA